MCLGADMDYNFQRNLLYFAAVEASGTSTIEVAQIQRQMTGGRFDFTLQGVFLFLIIQKVQKMWPK